MVHLLDVESKLGEVPYLGAMFIGLIVASLVLAEGLLRRDDLLLWLAVGALAAGPVVGYLISRTVGLPGEHGEEIGNWTEGLGLASLLVEGLVLWLAASRIISRGTVRTIRLPAARHAPATDRATSKEATPR